MEDNGNKEAYDPFEQDIQNKSDTQNGRHDSKRKRSRSPVRRSRSRSRSPRNWRRGERNRDRDDHELRRKIREGPGGKVRLYVCNMPYDMTWQGLKDLFKTEVGTSVVYVELYENPNGKSSGAGAVEIKGVEAAEKAIEKMDRHEVEGRKIIVRPERDADRNRHMKQGGGGGGGRMGGDMGGMGGGNMRMGGGMNMGGSGNMGMSSNLPAGISPAVLQQLNINPDMVTSQVFVANLDYKVNEKKIREIFKMAGNIIDIDFKMDDAGKSRGMCVVRFEHAVEAIQAISMFNGQVLYERTMSVKMDKMSTQDNYSQQKIPSKLPSGLKSIGMGLGSGGTPVNVQQMQSNLMPGPMGAGMGMNSMGMGGSTGGSMGGGMMGGSMGMNTGMGNMGSSMGGMGMGSSMGSMGSGMGTGMGSGMGSGMGTGMGSGMGTGMGTGMSSGMSSMGTGMGTGMSTGGMGMSSMSGMGSSMGSMGGDMSLGSSSGMGMRNGMTSPTGMSGMGSGMGSMGSDLSSGMGGGMGGGMSSGMGMNTGMGGMGSMGGSSMAGGMGSGLSGLESFTSSGGMNLGRDSGSSMESTTVFVRNLPFSFSWQDLKNKFSKCGEVKYVELKTENGKSKGYGTVKFMTSEDARRAVNLMNGARIESRQIEVRLNRV